jgi:hypothetical protein
MGQCIYKFNRGLIEFVTTFHISDEQNVENVAKSLNALIVILGLKNKLEVVNKKNVNDSDYPHRDMYTSSLEKLHTHPKMEYEKKIDPTHVIVDKQDLEEAKQKLAKYEQDEMLRGPEPWNRICIAPDTFEKLIDVLKFYGDKIYYGANLRAELNTAILGDNDSIRVYAIDTALGKDKGEQARSILKELTNKK